jgi:hypothetical protein
MRSIEAVFLSIGLLGFSAALNHLRAQDANEPADAEQPLYKAPRAAAQPGITTTGALHPNAFGKPCIQYDTAARALLVDKNVFDYVVAVTNKCPRAIKVQICQKGGTGCSAVMVQAYRSTDVVMGFGPNTDAFAYIAKETP